MEPNETGGVWVTTGQIYAKLLDLERKVDSLVGQDLPKRVRTLEVRSWAIPPNIVIGVLGLVAALAKS